MDSTIPKVSLKNKFGFALGHVLNDMLACIGVTYELVFFHKVLLLSNFNSGLLVLVGQIADALSTVFVGTFSDKGDDFCLCRKFGNRKSWHLIGVLCSLFAFPFLFSLCINCESSHESAKLVYYSAFMIIFQFGWASMQISHLAVIPELAQNSPNEKIGLTAIRYTMTVISTILVYFLAWIFLKDSKSSVTPEDYLSFQKLALTCCFIGGLCSIGYHTISRLPNDDNTRPNHENESFNKR